MEFRLVCFLSELEKAKINRKIHIQIAYVSLKNTLHATLFLNYNYDYS
jgi:hypothetical protein